MTRYAILRNRVTLVALSALILAGVQAYFDLPRAMDPGFTIRVAQVVTRMPGASPERVEQLITDRIEQVVQEIPELDTVTSTSRTGVSIVTVQVREEFSDMRPIWDNLRRKVERIQNELPDGAGTPSVNDEFGDVFGVMIAVTSDGFSPAETRDFAEEVRDELLHVEDVAKVELLGVQEERVFVEYENARLSRAGLSPAQLRDVLAAENIINPGGELRFTDETLVVEPSGSFERVEDIENALVVLPDGTVIRLGDLTDVRRGYADPARTLVSHGGEPAVLVSVSMRDGGNLVAMGERLTEQLAVIQPRFPHGIDLNPVFFEPTAVDTQVNDFVSNVLQAVGIVLVVMMLFLGLRSGVVVASLIPAVIAIALLGMSIFDIGLDQVSLAALIIALGLLVDNAIVIAESIQVRMAAGEERVEAGVNAAAELWLPLLVASLTTSSAFLPIFLAESAVGEFTASLFKVVTLTLLISWALCLTMTPTLCVMFMKTPKETVSDEKRFDTAFFRRYRATLEAGMRRPWLSLGVVAVAFGLAMWGFGFVPALFFPQSSRPILTASVSFPQGTPIERTQELERAIDRHLREELEVGDERNAGAVEWTSIVGGSFPRFVLGYNPTVANPSDLTMMIEVSDSGQLDPVADDLERFVIDHFPDAEPIARRLSNGPPASNPIEVRLSARTDEALWSAVNEVKQYLRDDLEGAQAVRDNWGPRRKKIWVQVDPVRARRAGVTNLAVAHALSTHLTGMETTRFREGDQRIPVTLRAEADERGEVERLRSIPVMTARGPVPLGQVADFELRFQYPEVLRRDRLRTVTVISDLRSDVGALEAGNEVRAWLADRGWEGRVQYEVGGELESSSEANASIGAKLPIAGLLIVFLLVFQFNSIRKTVIVLVTIPLALIGVVAGLLIMDSYFGFMTLLGIVSLAGIVINNAIVLLDRIQIEIDEGGKDGWTATVESAQQRLRPILLTTVTSVASLIPLYLGGGEMFQPMAVAIMFGLVVATVLTLGVVPIFYRLFYRAQPPA
ncbi:MAG: efflux RND transporter permease subunit [Sandaracinaceae bacterium]